MSAELKDAIAQLRAETERLRHRCAALEAVVERQGRRLVALDELAVQVRAMHFWDHSVYEVVPDESFVAVDRDEAVGLLGALAEVDHWRPWHTTVEHTR